MSQTDQSIQAAHSSFSFTVSLTPAATAAASSVEQAFTLPAGLVPGGLFTTDCVDVTGPGSGNALGIGGARINSTGQLVIAFINPTAGALTHAAGSFIVAITRP